MKKVSCLVGMLLVLSVGAGCAEEQGEGTLGVEIWGEEFIEDGIPAVEFADGYGITYSTFLVVVSNVLVATESGSNGVEAAASKVWDLTQAGPFMVVEDVVSAAAYSHGAYVIGPATAASVAGNAHATDAAFMKQNGYSVYVEGSATDGTTTKQFAWGFATNTLYDPCHSVGVVEEDSTAAVQLTIHGDHLFYDSAVSEEPLLRFADMALADTDGDNVVSQEELAAYDISALSFYGVGSMAINNMWDYVTHMTTTLGHIDGEGHCEVTVQ